MWWLYLIKNSKFHKYIFILVNKITKYNQIETNKRKEVGGQPNMCHITRHINLITSISVSIQVLGLSEDYIFSMTYSCLYNSTTSSGDKIGMTSRSIRALKYPWTSSWVVCQLGQLGLYVSLQLTLLFPGTKKCLLQVSSPLDNTIMSLLGRQG